MSEFRTIKGYAQSGAMTHAMEDYLEMICRCSKDCGYIRIRQLSNALHVKPSSACKMAEQLSLAGLIEYEKYGYIRPTEEGWRMGDYLLQRHQILHRFLCLVNHSEDELEQVEKIEHFLDKRTIEHLAALVEKLGREQQP